MVVICQYCKKTAKFVDSKIIYGKSYGMIYLCKECNAYVGVHKGTNRPLGILANAELREWKKKAHASFDPLWKTKLMTRREAYEWLAKQMGKSLEKCHIGMFDVSECEQFVALVTQYNQRLELLNKQKTKGEDINTLLCYSFGSCTKFAASVVAVAVGCCSFTSCW